MLRIRLAILVTTAVLCCSAGVALADGGPIMPLSEVQAGMDCTGQTVLQGTTISPFDVHVIDVVQDPQLGARVLISVSGAAVEESGIAQGFSGSPVYCPDATGTRRNIGAISEGVGQFGNNVAEVTPIEQMLGEPVLPPASAPRLAVRGRPLLGPLAFGGLSASWMKLVQRAGARAGRSVLAVPSSGAAQFPVQSLDPGAAVAAAYSTGAVPVGAIGTVTYRNGQNVYAFGHELDGAGRRSLLLQDAYVYRVINNPSPGPDTSYKLAVAGHTLGTVTGDAPSAVIGRVGPAPPMTPVVVAAHDGDTGRTLTLNTQVADETDVGMPTGSSLLSLVAPLAVGQAATQIYDGPPANESGRMCVTVTIRESAAPLGFCNRYVGTGTPGDQGDSPPEVALSAAADLSTALGLIDSVQFASIHVTRLAATIDARRGLAQARIVSAHARHKVAAGKPVTISLRVRVYRGPLRTIHLRVRVPRGAHGRLLAKISNAASAPSAQSLGSQLAQALSQAFGVGGLGEPGPSSIPALRAAFAGTSVYDGLVVRFKGHAPIRAYLDPNLLVVGQAKLEFRVRRPKRR